uniref:Uncharacterized protein n=1 Tax=Nelumbo nucifera TaxID=4432 RepID=A0A822Y7X2_NELNU|nr:TPA_asm: hypothetical protein HUJ06_031602 [Nelumbo nucifera]
MLFVCLYICVLLFIMSFMLLAVPPIVHWSWNVVRQLSCFAPGIGLTLVTAVAVLLQFKVSKVLEGLQLGVSNALIWWMVIAVNITPAVSFRGPHSNFHCSFAVKIIYSPQMNLCEYEFRKTMFLVLITLTVIVQLIFILEGGWDCLYSSG